MDKKVLMMNTDLGFRVKELSEVIEVMNSKIDLLRTRLKEDELWDNSDLIRYWKISKRLLDSWRSEGLIDYVQLGNKIWYTKENREEFLLRNMVKNVYAEANICSN